MADRIVVIVPSADYTTTRQHDKTTINGMPFFGKNAKRYEMTPEELPAWFETFMRDMQQGDTFIVQV